MKIVLNKISLTKTWKNSRSSKFLHVSVCEYRKLPICETPTQCHEVRALTSETPSLIMTPLSSKSKILNPSLWMKIKVVVDYHSLYQSFFFPPQHIKVAVDCSKLI